MRMWMVSPKFMCSRHLLGEHVECHMFVGAIHKGQSIAGYVSKSLVDTAKLQKRHNAIACEMMNRGMNHNSPLEYTDMLQLGFVDVEKSKNELFRRCKNCKEK